MAIIDLRMTTESNATNILMNIFFLDESKFYTATVFLHAHLQVVYYNCVKFHKNSISSLVGVALTRYTTPLLVLE
jgi:hypothetical protein